MTPSKPPIVRLTRALPFDQLPWDDFERLCLMLLPREGFENSKHYGAAGGERGRDIIAHRDGNLWYVQCKRVKRCGPKVLLDEIGKVQGLMEEDPDLRPVGMLFMVSCDVSATARDRASKRCKELGLACEVWGRTDLDAHVQPHSDIVRTLFGWYTRPPLGVPFQAPPLPAHFVPRPEVSDILKARLTDQTTDVGILVVSAIHGLGGIGKSTLAVALAYDGDVQERFPNGVLWATLGQQPDLLSILSGWIQVLGDYDFRPNTVEVASAHLRSLLHDKAVLLVVDDIWDPSHALPFKVGGPECQVLITTRQAAIASVVGADLYDLDVMKPEQALMLLSRRLGYYLEAADLEQAKVLAEAVGHLPLALELAAAQIADGVSWVDLIEDLQTEIARLDALDVPGAIDVRDEASLKRLSLRASFYLSIRRLSKTNRRCFAWLGILPEDVNLNPKTASILWDMDTRQAQNTLRYLRSNALLSTGPTLPDGTLTYRLHDLLHDLARHLLQASATPSQTTEPPGFDLKVSEAHACLLERYRKVTRRDRWHTLPNDGYIHRYLTWHMEQAGWIQEIHDLMREETPEGHNAWFEVREQLGQIPGYLEDVNRAWQLAKGWSYDDDRYLDIGLQCRYALIVASLNSLAQNIPPDLLFALLEKSVWTLNQGVAYACQVPDVKQRVQMLNVLMDRMKAMGYSKDVLMLARNMKDVDRKAKMISALVLRPFERTDKDPKSATISRQRTQHIVTPRTDGTLSSLRFYRGHKQESQEHQGSNGYRVYEQGEECSRQDKWDLDDIFQLADSGCPEVALDVALDTGIDEVVSRLSQRLGELQYFDEAWEAVQQISDSSVRAEALSVLIPLLPNELLKLVLAEIWHIESVEDKSSLLSDLAQHSSEELLEEMVAACLETDIRYATLETDIRYATTLLSALAPYLSRHLLGEIATAISQNEHTETRVRMIVQLIPYMPDNMRETEVRKALKATRRVFTPEVRARILRALLPHSQGELKQQILSESLSTIARIGNAKVRMNELSSLVRHLPTGMLRSALVVARHIGDRNWRGQVERTLKLTSLWTEASQRRTPLGTQKARWRFGVESDSEVPGRFDIEPENPAPMTMQELTHRLVRLAARLEELSYYMEETEDREHYMEASATVSNCASRLTKMSHPKDLLKTLEEITEWLNFHSVDMAEWGYDGDWVALLTGIAGVILEVLPEAVRLGQRKEALDAALSIDQPAFRVSMLLELARLFARSGYVEEAIETILKIEDLATQIIGVCDLSHYLPETLLRKVLAMVQQVESEKTRSYALVKLTPRLAELGYPQEALILVREIQLRKQRASAFINLTRYLISLPNDTLAKIWSGSSHNANLLQFNANLLQFLARRTRTELLSDIDALAPVIYKLGGEESIAETIRAIQDVGRWWP